MEAIFSDNTRRNSRRVVCGFGALSLIAASLTVIWLRGREPSPRPETPQQVALRESSGLLKQVEGGDGSSAVTELKRRAGKATDPDVRATYDVALAHSYFELNRPHDALASALRAEDSRPTAESAALIATAYRNLGDYANAAKYFGIAAERSPEPRDERERAPRNDYLIEQREAEDHLK